MNIQLYLKEAYSFILLLVISIITIQAQDTIPINLYKSTQLVFNQKIKNIVIGTGGLQIQKTVLDNVISLISKSQKKDFVNTNLYISTKNGFHYNFEILYKERPKKWTIAIKEDAATIKPSKITNLTSSGFKNIEIQKTDLNNLILKSVLLDKKRAKRYYKRFDNIYFRYVNHYYYNQFIYYKLEITNSSNQDFIIDFLKIFIDTKGKKRSIKKSNTRKLLRLNDDYTLINGDNFINASKTTTIVLKLKKISLNKEQKITFELKEKNGNRDLNLNLNSWLVNSPYPLNL